MAPAVAVKAATSCIIVPSEISPASTCGAIARMGTASDTALKPPLAMFR